MRIGKNISMLKKGLIIGEIPAHLKVALHFPMTIEYVVEK